MASRRERGDYRQSPSKALEWLRGTDLAPDEPEGLHYSVLTRLQEFQECDHHSTRQGPWSGALVATLEMAPLPHPNFLTLPASQGLEPSTPPLKVHLRRFY